MKQNNNKSIYKSTRLSFGLIVRKITPNHHNQERINDIETQSMRFPDEKKRFPMQLMAEWIPFEMDRVIANGRNSQWYKEPTEGKTFYKGLITAKCVLFEVYNLLSVKSEVATCLHHGTPVVIYNSFDGDNLLMPTSVDEWYAICDGLTADFKEDNAKDELVEAYASFDDAWDATMRSEIPWIDTKYANLFEQFAEVTYTVKKKDKVNAFLEYCQAIIDEIREMGEWDVECGTHYAPMEKSSVFTYVATQGEHKGLRTTGSSDRFGIWENYKTAPADILREYLSLTFYVAMGIEPLYKVITNGADYIPVGNTDGYNEDEYMTTPLYVDPNESL